jgi:hypothetical protein
VYKPADGEVMSPIFMHKLCTTKTCKQLMATALGVGWRQSSGVDLQASFVRILKFSSVRRQT